MVYVLNSNGKALMPTTRFGKVRRMLRVGQAVVVRREPFTIRLCYDTTDFTQPVCLGIDAGTAHIGISATTDAKELYAAEVQLRKDVTDLLASRRECRKTRRNRLRYRKARFDNRRRTGRWMAPSVENRIEMHLKAIRNVYAILPVSNLTIEVAQFDTQLIKNPETEGLDYQQGEQLGFWNVREYVLCRDNHTCQHCKGKSKDAILNVHHLESRKTGGNAPNNLITLCETCHKEYHKGKFELKIKRGTILRDAAAMGIMRWEIYDRAKKLFNDVHLTYGYITKNTRIRNNVAKSHVADARCISGNPLVMPLDFYYYCKQVRRHNRQIHKTNLLKGGRKKLNQAPYLVKGFRLFDKVYYNCMECFIFGRRSSGSFDIRMLDGTKVNAGVSYKKLRLIEKRKSILTQRRNTAQFLPDLKERGSLCNCL